MSSWTGTWNGIETKTDSISTRNHPHEMGRLHVSNQWEFQDPIHWGYVSTIFWAIFCGDIPWNLGQKYMESVPPMNRIDQISTSQWIGQRDLSVEPHQFLQPMLKNHQWMHRISVYFNAFHYRLYHFPWFYQFFSYHIHSGYLSWPWKMANLYVLMIYLLKIMILHSYVK